MQKQQQQRQNQSQQQQQSELVDCATPVAPSGSAGKGHVTASAGATSAPICSKTTTTTTTNNNNNINNSSTVDSHGPEEAKNTQPGVVSKLKYL
jgi:hypothetical protein